MADYAACSDEELMARLLRRDARALEALYDRHGRALYSLALRMLGDSASAEEVLQECFLKLWRSPERYQRERGRPLTWLLGVTHHRAVDELRRRRAERRLIDGTPDGAVRAADPAQGPEEQAWEELERQSLVRALADLPEAQRRVLELAYFEGMTQAEISAYLGEPLGTVKTRVRLAMQKLRAVSQNRVG